MTPAFQPCTTRQVNPTAHLTTGLFCHHPTVMKFYDGSLLHHDDWETEDERLPFWVLPEHRLGLFRPSTVAVRGLNSIWSTMDAMSEHSLTACTLRCINLSCCVTDFLHLSPTLAGWDRHNSESFNFDVVLRGPLDRASLSSYARFIIEAANTCPVNGCNTK